jgi:hypothetical protein
MEMNVEKKTMVMRISRQPLPIQIVTHQKQPENVEYFKYLGSMITNEEDESVKLNPELSLQKQHSTRRRLFSPANWT